AAVRGRPAVELTDSHSDHLLASHQPDSCSENRTKIRYGWLSAAAPPESDMAMSSTLLTVKGAAWLNELRYQPVTARTRWVSRSTPCTTDTFPPASHVPTSTTVPSLAAIHPSSALLLASSSATACLIRSATSPATPGVGTSPSRCCMVCGLASIVSPSTSAMATIECGNTNAPGGRGWAIRPAEA